MNTEQIAAVKRVLQVAFHTLPDKWRTTFDYYRCMHKVTNYM